MRAAVQGLTAMLCAVLFVQNAGAGEVTIERPWVMLPPPNSTAAAFMTIHNETAKDIQLIGAASSSARRVEIHRSVIEEGVARMEPLGKLMVPAGQSVMLAPRGIHLMLIDPIPLSEADEVEIELNFSDQVSRKVKAAVLRAAPDGRPASHHHSHH